MENFDVFYDSCPHNIISNQSVEKDTTTTRKENGTNFRTICDISNVDRCRSEKLIRPNVARKYRSVYLKKYVWSKGVRHYRRYKKAFVIPVIHVSRRPDNPFNVKTVVENLKRKQMTSPLHKTTDSNEHLSVGEELCYSSLEKQIVKTRNWEAIRYKYQLDYKERLKMERENYLKKCADMKEMSQKQHNVEHLRQFHPNTDECIRKGPYSAVVSNEELIVDPVHSNRHIDERQKNLVSSTETQVAAFNGVTSVANESKNYYPHIKYDDSVCKSIDSTDDYKNRNPFNGGEVEQMQFNRNERGDNIQSEVKQNKITVDSNTVIVSPTMDHEMPKRSQDFDFSIPFNESNILVKVMTPDRKNPSNVCNQHPQPHSLLQNTLLHDTKPTKPDSKSSKRVLSDEESKTNNIRHNSGPRSEWLQYIQNLLNKTTKLADHPAETSKPYFDHCPIPTSTIQKPSVAHVNTTNSQLTKYPDPQSIGRVKVDRPMVSNPRLIRPKVMHPSPYYRSDFFRNNPLYNEPMEDPIVLNMPVRRHSPASLIPDQPSIPPHIEYTYANRPNYRHDFMVRNMQLPLDMSQSHPNLMGQPMYSPYDQQYMQYPIEMERMPHPYIDRFVQHNNVAPPNRSIGFLPPRPIVPGVYRYLNPQHDHPLWIYPHMLER